jgi:hypothetical protein
MYYYYELLAGFVPATATTGMDQKFAFVVKMELQILATYMSV